jgi:RNA polymerase II elongation factor ELL
VRPYEFAGLTDNERRKMRLQARQSLHSLGIPETDPAWDHVRTPPGPTGTDPSKAVAGPKRATGTVNAERKKNTGSTSKPLVEAKDEGVRPSQTVKVREETTQTARSMKAVPMRDDNPPPRRPPVVSGPKNAREMAPTQSQSQAQGPSKKTGLIDARAKLGGSSKPNGRSGPATHIPTLSSHERELERERPTHPTKKEREDVSDLDREKGKTVAVHKAKRRKDDMSDLDSLRDWDGTDTMGKANAKRKKLREDYDDKDRINGTGNTAKRRKVLDDDKPYKPGGGGGGGTKARERDRDKEQDRGKTRDRDPPHMAKRQRDSDWDTPDPPPPPRKSTVRERDRQREREPDRSVSPPRHIKREYSLSPALHNSPLPRATTKRADSPPRHSVKRESSPRLRGGHSRRDVSPLVPQTSKRATSPSRSQNRPRDRHRETSSNGGSTSRRRRSPIYTSSEDEQQQNVPVRRNAPSSVTSSSSSRDAGHVSPPTVPYPKDREGLEARYRSGYRNYIAVYYKLLDERAKIQDALEDTGREGSVGSDRDVEMMDEEGLRELKGQYMAWTRELEGIRNAYSTEAERMDIKP